MSSYLLDTHALIWWFEDSPRLTQRVRRALLADGAIAYASAASAYEIASKHRLGKLPQVSELLGDYAFHISSQGFLDLAVTAAHARAAGLLAIEHRDPFDRILIAQSRIDNLVLISNEHLFDAFGVERLWD